MWKVAIIGHGSQGAQHSQDAGHYPGCLTLLEELAGGTRLAMPKTICAPDSSSLKPGSGATKGVLD